MDLRISVIVPVYNAEKYIARCVASVLRQTFRDFELLLIVDGATDGSAEICRELAARDGRITVVEKENEGVSATRNRGLQMARGEYVCFLDADDRISENYLEALYKAVLGGDAQMALCWFAYERNEGIVPSEEPELPAFDRETDSLYQKYICPMFRIGGAGYIMGSSCRSIIRRQMLVENEISFPPCKLYEDQLFMLNAMAACRKIAVSGEALYYYNNCVGDSALHTKYKSALPADQQIYLEHLERCLEKLPITEQEKKTVWQYAILNARKLLLTNAAMNPQESARREEIRQIRGSGVFAEKIPPKVYWQWFIAQPRKTAAAEVLLRLHMYGLLRKLRSR